MTRLSGIDNTVLKPNAKLITKCSKIIIDNRITNK